MRTQAFAARCRQNDWFRERRQRRELRRMAVEYELSGATHGSVVGGSAEPPPLATALLPVAGAAMSLGLRASDCAMGLFDRLLAMTPGGAAAP